MKRLLFACFVLLSVTGCVNNQSVPKADSSNLKEEGMASFARPAQYVMRFGTHSQRDMFEIVYQEFSRNEAGQPMVRMGIRYRGPVRWFNWFMRAPEYITILGQCNFYNGTGAQNDGGPVIYATNSRALTIRLGETYNYQAVCPVKTAQSCQVVLSEKYQ